MLIAWHPERREKRNRSNYSRVVKVCVDSIQYEGIRDFWYRKLYMNSLV